VRVLEHGQVRVAADLVGQAALQTERVEHEVHIALAQGQDGGVLRAVDRVNTASDVRAVGVDGLGIAAGLTDDHAFAVAVGAICPLLDGYARKNSNRVGNQFQRGTGFPIAQAGMALGIGLAGRIHVRIRYPGPAAWAASRSSSLGSAPRASMGAQGFFYNRTPVVFSQNGGLEYTVFVSSQARLGMEDHLDGVVID
jgi:hypothetical protein